MEFYEEYQNNFYTPLEKAGDNENWKAIEKAFHKVESELSTPFIVTFTNDAPTEFQPMAGHVDKTEEEISKAVDEGRQIVGHIVSEQLNLDFYTPMSSYGVIDGKISIAFVNMGIIANEFVFIRLSTNIDSLEYNVETHILQVITNP